MRILGIIPARAGSKGIKNKNRVEFCGMPLVVRSMYLLRQCYEEGLVDDMAISTDDDDVLSGAAMSFHITGIKRPPELATDEAPVIAAVRHALGLFKDFDAVLLLQPTNPLRNLDDICGAIALLEAHPEADSVISHIPARCHPARMRRPTPHNQYVQRLVTSERIQGTPRQQLPPILQRTGEIYLTRTSCIARGRDLEGECCVPWMQDPARAWDIDGPEDLIIAEALWRASQKS